ncbi:MAG: polyprenol phosphomannose-dependent alpha 1,6 mannosyltransferase MptB [Mycobacteriales bacterium]
MTTATVPARVASSRSDGRYRMLGAVGALLLGAAALAGGSLARPDPLRHGALGWLRHPSAANALWLAGAVVLGWSWFRLRAAGLPFLRVTMLVWAVPFAVTPPLFSRDAYLYANLGQLAQGGLSPYAHGPADLPTRWLDSMSVSWQHSHSPYGPLFLIAARAAVAVAGGHLWVAIALLRVLALVGVALLAVYVPRLAAACGVDPGGAFWLGVLNPLVLGHLVSGAHADALMLGLMVAGAAYAAEGRPAVGVAIASLGVTVKAPAALALPFVTLLWAERRGSRYGTAGAVAAAVAVFGVVFVAVSVGTGLGFGWLGGVSEVGANEQWTSVSTGVGMAVDRLGASGALHVTRPIGLVVAAVLVAWLWWRAARGDRQPRPVVLAMGWSFAALVLLSPVVHPWYLLWFLTVLAAAGVAGWARVALACLSLAASVLVRPDGFNLARSSVGAGETVDVLVVAAVAVWVGVTLRRATLRERAS